MKVRPSRCRCPWPSAPNNAQPVSCVIDVIGGVTLLARSRKSGRVALNRQATDRASGQSPGSPCVISTISTTAPGDLVATRVSFRTVRIGLRLTGRTRANAALNESVRRENLTQRY